jgi:hypothetical protein
LGTQDGNVLSMLLKSVALHFRPHGILWHIREHCLAALPRDPNLKLAGAALVSRPLVPAAPCVMILCMCMLAVVFYMMTRLLTNVTGVWVLWIGLC